MSDLICSKTMRRCDTPDMCVPWGGCSAQRPADAGTAGSGGMTRDETMARIAEAEAFFAAKRREAAIDEAVRNAGFHFYYFNPPGRFKKACMAVEKDGLLALKRRQGFVEKIRAEFRKLTAQGAPVAA